MAPTASERQCRELSEIMFGTPDLACVVRMLGLTYCEAQFRIDHHALYGRVI